MNWAIKAPSKAKVRFAARNAGRLEFHRGHPHLGLVTEAPVPPDQAVTVVSLCGCTMYCALSSAQCENFLLLALALSGPPYRRAPFHRPLNLQTARVRLQGGPALQS